MPNLNLTPEEKRIYGLLFRQADTDSVGVVTGDVAVKFFEKTRLDSAVLGEVSSGSPRPPNTHGHCVVLTWAPPLTRSGR